MVAIICTDIKSIELKIITEKQLGNFIDHFKFWLIHNKKHAIMLINFLNGS